MQKVPNVYNKRYATYCKIGTFWFSPVVENIFETAEIENNNTTIFNTKKIKQHKMEKDPWEDFIREITKQQEQKSALERRKKYFQTIGRKGGLKKKTANQFSRTLSTRLTEKEFEEIEKNATRYNLTISKYVRLILTETELKINEFSTDKLLLEYGNHFIRIKNLLRHREFSKLDSTKVVLRKVEEVTDLIYQYLYEKMNNQNTEGQNENQTSDE